MKKIIKTVKSIFNALLEILSVTSTASAATVKSYFEEKDPVAFFDKDIEKVKESRKKL